MDKQDLIKVRAIANARYIIDNKCTIRQCARALKVSKSTVHKDVAERLQSIDTVLYEKVRRILDVNLEQRAIRGGIATKNKYKGRNDKELKMTYPNVVEGYWIGQWDYECLIKHSFE